MQDFAAAPHRLGRHLRPVGPRPSASVNFVTVHDGFTLHDLVSYNDKHNEANAEDNRDGEQPQPQLELRRRRPDRRRGRAGAARAPEAQLPHHAVVSRGVPLLLGGDEIGRTQGGNNNAYCQDNESAGSTGATVPEAAHGDSYSYRLPDGTPCPTRPRASAPTTCTARAW
jgi:isoamylase